MGARSRAARTARVAPHGAPGIAHRVNRLRNRLVLVFVASTVAPLAVTLWITANLLERSLTYAPIAELDRISRSLERTGREFYQRACEDLREAAAAGKIKPVRYLPGERQSWPDRVDDFFESGEPERFLLQGSEGDRLEYYSRRGNQVWAWSQPLGAVAMGRLS